MLLPPNGSCYVQTTAEETYISSLNKSHISIKRINNINEFIEEDEQNSDFDEMMNEVQEEIEEHNAKEHKWMTAQMQKHIREINEMFADERKSVQKQYKEYAQTCLGRYAQKFFRLFFVLGSVIFSLAIFLILNRHYHWTK